MVVDSTIVFTEDLDFYLEFDREFSHPIICQIGGCKSDRIREATEKVLEYGYDEINLNMGCPSHRVEGEHKFGALLMKQVDVAEQAVEAMQAASKDYSKQTSTRTPISVKCRVGVDDFDTLEDLVALIRRLRDRGCRIFYLHARKALLGGMLNPSQNRDVPPLNYPRVYEVCRVFPDCDFYINGGIKTLSDAKEVCYGLGTSNDSYEASYPHGKIPCESCGFWNGSCVAPPQNFAPENLRGCLLGRAAVENPALFWDVDRYFYGENRNPCQTRRQILSQYCKYLENIYPRRCCDQDPSVTSRITNSRAFPVQYDYCSKCASLYEDEHHGSPSVAPLDFSNDHGTKITSHVVNRSVKPVNNIFFGLPKSSLFRQRLHELARNDSIHRNCGPSALIKRALLVVPEEFLDRELVKSEQVQTHGMSTKKRPTNTASSRLFHLLPFAMALLLISSYVVATEGILDANVNTTEEQASVLGFVGQEEIIDLDREDSNSRNGDKRDATDFPYHFHDEEETRSNQITGLSQVSDNQKAPVVMAAVDVEVEGTEGATLEDDQCSAPGDCVEDLSLAKHKDATDPTKQVHAEVERDEGDDAVSNASFGDGDAESLISEGEPQLNDHAAVLKTPDIVDENENQIVVDSEAENRAAVIEEHGGDESSSSNEIENQTVVDSEVEDRSVCIGEPGGEEPSSSNEVRSESIFHLQSADVMSVSNTETFEGSMQGQADREVHVDESDGETEKDVVDPLVDHVKEATPQHQNAKHDSISTKEESVSLSDMQSPEDNNTPGAAAETEVEEVSAKERPDDSSTNLVVDDTEAASLKGSLASFFESAKNKSSMNSFAHQLEEQESLLPVSKAKRRKNNLDLSTSPYRGEPWGHYRPTRRIPDIDLLQMLFKDLVKVENEQSQASPEVAEMLEEMKNDPDFDASQLRGLFEMSGDSSMLWEPGHIERDNETQDESVVDDIISPDTVDANSDFVEGLDDIGKFFEGVDPPDELDVGASGLSIQEVLMGKGRQIFVKKMVQLVQAIRSGWKRLIEGLGNPSAQKKSKRDGITSHTPALLKHIRDVPRIILENGKIGVERLVDFVDGLVDHFDREEVEEESSTLDFTSSLSSTIFR
jgi:tRNA-dihydrouridine synthase